jgi:gas vesicle protein
MTNNNEYEYRESCCTGFAGNTGQKLLFFMIGGGIGAAIALLLAPKKGSELRRDIADMTAKGIDQTAFAANQLKQRTAEIYKTAKETGSEVLDVVAAGATAVKEEVTSDVEKIGAIVENSAKRAVGSRKPIGIA